MTEDFIRGLCKFCIAKFSETEEDLVGLVFVSRIQDGTAIAANLSTVLGVEVPLVHGSLSKVARDDIAAKMRACEIRLAVATSVWSAGINIPNIGWVVRTSNGVSKISLEQEAGRGSRLAPGKRQFDIYDVVDVASENGMANAELRASEWRERGYAGLTLPASGVQLGRHDAALTARLFADGEDETQQAPSVQIRGAATDESVEAKIKRIEYLWSLVNNDDPKATLPFDPVHRIANNVIYYIIPILAVLACFLNALLT